MGGPPQGRLHGHVRELDPQRPKNHRQAGDGLLPGDANIHLIPNNCYR